MTFRPALELLQDESGFRVISALTLCLGERALDGQVAILRVEPAKLGFDRGGLLDLIEQHQPLHKLASARRSLVDLGAILKRVGSNLSHFVTLPVKSIYPKAPPPNADRLRPGENAARRRSCCRL